MVNGSVWKLIAIILQQSIPRMLCPVNDIHGVGGEWADSVWKLIRYNSPSKWCCFQGLYTLWVIIITITTVQNVVGGDLMPQV